MNKNNDQKLSFSQRLIKYRKIIMIIGFLVIVPIVTITSLYVTTFNRYRNVNFGNSVVQRNFERLSVVDNEDGYDVFQFETDNIIVTITLTDMLIPQYEIDDSGFYEFEVTWKQKTGKQAPKNSIQLVLVVQADWMNATSGPKNLQFPTTVKTQTIKVPFDYKLGSPLWFVNVKRPNLFIMTTYETDPLIAGGPTVSNRFFHMGALTKIEPVPAKED